MSTFTVGPYTVRIGIRFDSPYWPLYIVFKGEKLIGKIFSRPDEGACAWLERRLREEEKWAPEPKARFIMRSFVKKRDPEPA